MDVQRHEAGRSAGGESCLIGAAALVLIAQPWDFQTLHGRGRLLGRICDDLAYGPSGRELRLAIRPQVIHSGRGPVDILRVLALHDEADDPMARLSRGESAGVRLYSPPGRGGRPVLGAMWVQA